MKKIYIILIVVVVLTLSVILISCPNNATDIIPDDTDIVPEGLPPDPGEAGKVTVEGIDSDGDGVRDDVQRYIALEQTDEGIQAILMDYAKITQKYMVSEEELALIEDKIIANFNSDTIVDRLYEEDPNNAYDILLEMEGVLLNTKDRLVAASRAYSLYSK